MGIRADRPPRYEVGARHQLRCRQDECPLSRGRDRAEIDRRAGRVLHRKPSEPDLRRKRQRNGFGSGRFNGVVRRNGTGQHSVRVDVERRQREGHRQDRRQTDGVISIVK